jgi:hypothetical protein
MLAHKLTPILNVSDITESFRWFEKLGNGGVKMTLDVAWPPTDMPWGVREMHEPHRTES